MAARLRIVLTLVSSLTLFAADQPTVAISTGQIEGRRLNKEDGAAFKGIPYAQAPVGDLRWREPRPAKAWSGVREAAEYGAPCAQNAGGKMQEGSSEDCLFLNVWNSEWPAVSRKPVMVWFHGGGNYGGTA